MQTKFGIMRTNAWGGNSVVVETGFLHKMEAIKKATELAMVTAGENTKFVVFEEIASIYAVVTIQTVNHQSSMVPRDEGSHP